VGTVVGACVGCSVGAFVTKQLVSSFGSARKPSKHSHTHPSAAFTATVVLRSQPAELSLHSSSVGMCVGAVVGATLVGAALGAFEGT
jgi:hypothetical protein